MADKGGDKELPQRFRGEARAPTSPSGSPVAPVLSAELRQRLKTAVTAERAVRRPVNRIGAGGRAGSADAAQERPRAANAGPLTEDEVTEWIGTAGKSPEARARRRARCRARCRAGIR